MKKLYLVSIGPGDADLICPVARRAIALSTDLVAYRLYLDLLGDATADKRCHHHALGEETVRARLALDLAAAGNPTSLISSGDIGIYAMAPLVFELLDKQLQGAENHPEWLDVAIEIIPGVSAMQANSSAVGALLGHDFCSISLSDLLTPWATIAKRVHSAGAGDFVVSFYNPVSQQRAWQLNAARDILLAYRPAATPVVLGRNLTRRGHAVRIITLAELNAADVDMFTCVAVGNSETRHLINQQSHWVYTPRGYAKKL